LEEILKVFKAKYPGLRVVLTLGGDGSVYQDENLTLTQQRYTVPVKDTTAAGDTFLGYFVKEVASDDADISVALQLASMAAALAVSKEGAMPSVPVRQDVEAALAQL
jgi:ribokinase